MWRGVFSHMRHSIGQSAPMALFENLTARLVPHGRHPARPRPDHGRERRREPARGAHGAARGGCRAARGQGLHRARETEGARGGGHGEPVSRPGVRRNPAQGAGRTHAGRPWAVRAARAAAGRRVVSRPAGRGQDHHRRQTRALADRAEETGAAGEHGHPPSGRRAAAAATGGTGGRGFFRRRQTGPAARSRATRWTRRATASTTR